LRTGILFLGSASKPTEEIKKRIQKIEATATPKENISAALIISSFIAYRGKVINSGL